MNETTRKTIKTAVITAALTATVFVPFGLAVAGTPQASGEPSPITKAFNAGKAAIQGIFAPAKTASADQASARPEGVNLDMIYMPSKGNGVCTADQVQGIFAPAKTASADQASARPEGVNLDMIYMPSKGNGVCTADQGKRDSCMVDVVVTYADGVTRKEFGVYVGRDLIATNYELVTGHGDSHAVKPGDGHAYTVALSDGTTRKALPWAFVPGSVAVLRMQ